MRFFVVLLFFLTSCSSSKEFVINAQTGEKIAGYGHHCKYKIGKTTVNKIPESDKLKYQEDSIEVGFYSLIAGQEVQSDKLIWVSIGGQKYTTSKGVKVGDSVQKVIDIYGNPKSRGITYWEDVQHRIGWTFEGLFYDNMMFFTDSSKTQIKACIIGRYFDTDQKYIEKYKNRVLRKQNS